MSDAADAITPLLIRFAAVECAVRALIATHPDRAAVQAVFNQLFAQVQASTAGDGDAAASLKRQAAEALFRPPVVL